ncbi:unnamed protein product [Tenebrio molitor]|nr:unnamed protein product [Tenebrio molitor]
MTDAALRHIFESKYVDKEKNEILLQSIIHTAKTLEKSIRLKFMRALNYWFKVPKDKFEVINDVMLIKQSRVALCADVDENCQFRQNLATANAVYGPADALNACTYSSFIDMEKIWSFKNIEMVKLAAKSGVQFYRGKGMEISWTNSLKCPTEEEYFKVAVRKTGSAIQFMMRMMQLSSSNQADFTHLAEIFGKFFHVYDDYINLQSMDEYLIAENSSNSISQGKFSFPVIHAVRSHPEDIQLINILRQKTTNKEVLKYCVHLLEQFGSFEYTKQTLAKLRDEAEEEMEKFEENPYMLQLFEDIFSKLKIN